MDDLIAWLRAQIDKDEQVALGGNRGPWEVERFAALGGNAANVLMPNGDGTCTGLTRAALLGTQDAATMEHIARWDPVRVLAEVAAKRRILDEYASEYDDHRLALGKAVRLLAQPYAGRPGWREEWRPVSGS